MEYKYTEPNEIIERRKENMDSPKTEQEYLTRLHNLMEEVADSQKKNSILREISSICESIPEADLSAVIEETNFVENLLIFVNNTQTCFNSLEIILLLLKNSKRVVEILFNNNIFAVLVNVLSTSKIAKKHVSCLQMHVQIT